MENPEYFDRLQAYKAKQQNCLECVAPYLLKLDIDALRTLEGVYQSEQHDRLYGLPLLAPTVDEIHGDIKGARQFILWIEDKIKKTQK